MRFHSWIHALFSLSSGREIYSIRAEEAGHLLEFWSDNQDKEVKCEQKKMIKERKWKSKGKSKKRVEVYFERRQRTSSKVLNLNSFAVQEIFLYWKWRKPFWRSGFMKTQNTANQKQNQNHSNLQIREEKYLRKTINF